ncbi:MAG: endonuclease MutS2 [Dehalococcoidia bacterium]
MDIKSLEMLEFPRIREILASYTDFPLGQELAHSLFPSSNPGDISLLLAQSAEARRFLSVEPGFTLSNLTDVRHTVDMSTRARILEPMSLLEIRSVLSASNRVYSSFRKLSLDFPALYDIAKNVMPLPHLEEIIDQCIDPSGEILDTATAELEGIRRELKDTKRNLTNRLENLIKSEDIQPFLQESLITERSGRYVIPLKIEYQREIKGIIHDVSNTGATVFIEPMSIVELGNKLRQLSLEEEREIQRLLTFLSEQVAEHHTDILNNLSSMGELDLALAKARYAMAVNAIEPEIVNGGTGTGRERSGVQLLSARHPLLGQRAVPLTVELGDDFSGLVITGPNTGGKTVSLKTIGLMVAMAQSGVPIPAAEGSKLPVFDSIYADIGDEQSIEETVSSFSWHMGNIIRIIQVATDRSLILLDELGTSTDPAEGSALARAIMLHFLSMGALVAATTHYSELKVFAHATPGLSNASMEFDPATLAPTYRMVMGIPGGSNAFAVASHLGLPAAIIDQAREMMPHGSSQMESLLDGMASEQEAIRSVREELEREREQLLEFRNRIEFDIRNMEEEQQILLRDEKERIIREAAQLRREIQQAASMLKKEKSRDSISEAKSTLETAHEQLDSTRWLTQPSRSGEVEKTPDSQSISVGDSVRVLDTTIRGTVTSPPDKTGQIEVQAGRTMIKVDENEVERIEEEAETPVKRSYTVKKSEKSTPRSLELDLRGKRADEIEPELDTYLNDVSIAGFKQVRIIHGYGTGTARQVVRDMLASHPLVRSFRSGKQEEGGDGVTIAML